MKSLRENIIIWVYFTALCLLAPTKRFYLQRWSGVRSLVFSSAAYVGNIPALRSLMWIGAKVDDRETINDSTALHVAAGQGHTHIVKWLLARGADIHAGDSGGTTPLIRAAEGGHQETIQVLLEAGADVNAPNIFGTALTHAAGNGHISVLETLHRAGADVNATGRCRMTALRWAKAFHRRECIQWLERHGAME